MASNKFQHDFTALWRNLQNGLRRFGIHPAVALLGVFLLIIFPRFVIFGAIIYGVYWMYRNGVFSGKNAGSRPGSRSGSRPGSCGRQGGKGRGRRR